MQQVQLTTTDSSAWEFQDQSVTVHIEQGLYVPTAEKHDELNYRSLHRTIDGETCDIASFLVRKPDLLSEPAKKTCVIGRFSESQRVGDPVFISICFSTTDMESRAMEMLDSVVFVR